MARSESLPGRTSDDFSQLNPQKWDVPVFCAQTSSFSLDIVFLKIPINSLI